MAYCDIMGTETEFEDQGGYLVCPECGERLDEESLYTLAQPHYPDDDEDDPTGRTPYASDYA